MRLRLTAALLALLLTSCSGVSLRVDELLSPPRLTAEQSAIYDAIETAVGTDSFKLKYPRRGDYLSACVLTDLDRDGTDEAIAFYELTVNGVTSAWMSILVQKDGVWKSRQELPGEGAEIDFIDFAPVDRADHNNIIVGWIVAGQESMLCKVYDYDETVSLQYEGNYNECLIQDVDRNGLSEIVLCTVGGSRTPVMSLVKYRSGRIVRTSEVQMPSSMTGYAQLVCGQLTSGLTAICADIYLGNDGMTTRIAALDTQKSSRSCPARNSAFTNPLIAPPPPSTAEISTRTGRLICRWCAECPAMKNPTSGTPSISPSIKVLSTAACKRLPQWRSIFRTATVLSSRKAG